MTALSIRPLARLDARLVAPGERRRFDVVRIALAVALGVRLALRHWSEAAAIPTDLFQPTLVVTWLSGPPAAAVLTGVQVVGVLAAIVSVTPRRSQWSFVLTWLSLLFLAGVWGSAGKIMHNDVLLLLTAVPFVLARNPGPAETATASSGDTSSAWGWPPRTALVIVAVVYFCTGAQKLNHSGLDWVTTDNLRFVLLEASKGSISPFPGLADRTASLPWLDHLLAAGALGIELTAPVLLWFVRTRPVFIALIVGLHTGIWLTVGLDYYGWMLTVAAVAGPMWWFGRPPRESRPVSS